MQPANTPPTACPHCGAAVLPDIFTGEPIDAESRTDGPLTIWQWHRCSRHTNTRHPRHDAARFSPLMRPVNIRRQYPRASFRAIEPAGAEQPS